MAEQAPAESGRTTAQAQGSRGLTATLKRLQQSVEEKCHYEALQQYKALFYRSAARKKPEAVQVLEEGACVMLRHDQNEAGLELGILLINHLKATDANVSEPSKRSVTAVSSAFGFSSDARSQHIKFLQAAVEWSKGPDAGKCGDPDLHLRLAEAFDAEGDAAQAHAHYARGSEPGRFVAALGRWAGAARAEERPLFVTRAVLQCLCVGRLEAAEAVLQEGASMQGGGLQAGSPPYNLCRLLCVACRKQAPPLFHLLEAEYAPSLRADPSFGEYMTRIGEVHFGISRPKSGLQGLLGNLFGHGVG